MPPPKKQAGQGVGPRRLNGTMKDVSTMATLLGTSEGKVRSAVARGLLPYRRWGGRVVFLEDDVHDFLAKLPGITAEEALANIVRRRGGGAR